MDRFSLRVGNFCYLPSSHKSSSQEQEPPQETINEVLALDDSVSHELTTLNKTTREEKGNTELSSVSKSETEEIEATETTASQETEVEGKEVGSANDPNNDWLTPNEMANYLRSLGISINSNSALGSSLPYCCLEERLARAILLKNLAFALNLSN